MTGRAVGMAIGGGHPDAAAVDAGFVGVGRQVAQPELGRLDAGVAIGRDFAGIAGIHHDAHGTGITRDADAIDRTGIAAERVDPGRCAAGEEAGAVEIAELPGGHAGGKAGAIGRHRQAMDDAAIVGRRPGGRGLRYRTVRDLEQNDLAAGSAGADVLTVGGNAAGDDVDVVAGAGRRRRPFPRRARKTRTGVDEQVQLVAGSGQHGAVGGQRDLVDP